MVCLNLVQSHQYLVIDFRGCVCNARPTLALLTSTATSAPVPAGNLYWMQELPWDSSFGFTEDNMNFAVCLFAVISVPASDAWFQDLHLQIAESVWRPLGFRMFSWIVFIVAVIFVQNLTQKRTRNLWRKMGSMSSILVLKEIRYSILFYLFFTPFLHSPYGLVLHGGNYHLKSLCGVATLCSPLHCWLQWQKK